VQRRYSEFYALEAKLTEFHGEFEDVRLPPKAKFSLWKGLDVLQAKREVNHLCFFHMVIKMVLNDLELFSSEIGHTLTSVCIYFISGI